MRGLNAAHAPAQPVQIDPWWLEQHRELHEIGVWLRTKQLTDLDAEDMQQLKRRGFADSQIARCLGGCAQGWCCGWSTERRGLESESQTVLHTA